VILVRDQESKSKIPSFLEHALCLTIYEAKGLEFDDVILYNFFSDSSIAKEKWNILNNLNIEEESISLEEFTSSITYHDKLIED